MQRPPLFSQVIVVAVQHKAVAVPPDSGEDEIAYLKSEKMCSVTIIIMTKEKETEMGGIWETGVEN